MNRAWYTQTGHKPTQDGLNCFKGAQVHREELHLAIAAVIRLAKQVDDYSELQAAIRRLEELL